MSHLLNDCTALIIDANPTSRSVLSSQLRDFGLATVNQSGRVTDARRLLETRNFDIVLCEMEFHVASGARAQTGQELLDELRQANLLPWSTVFIMVTGERSYAKVAEAAESALDSYLIKPFTAAALEDRVLHARQRKRVLADIYTAIENGEFESAARMCTQRFRDKAPYWLYAARLGAELLLRLEMHTAARHLLDAVIAHQALPWARLGIARAQLAANQTTPALRTLESLLIDEPTYADAFDVMARTQVAQGHLEQALETYQKAAELTPGAVRRQQKFGMLAFYSGDMTVAGKALERAVILGQGSKMFDYQVLVLLAIVRFRQRDSKALARCVADLTRGLEKAPNSVRLQRFARIIGAFDLMLRRQVAQVIEQLKSLATEIRAPDFDVEAGSNLLTAVAQLTAAELNLPDAEMWVEAVAARFSGTRGVSELLASAAGAHPPFAELVKQSHQKITEAAERSLMHSISGNPDAAIDALLGHAGSTLNQKFLDTARGVLSRYAAKINDAPRHALAIEAMRLKTGQRNTSALPLGLEDEVGGIRLRATSTPPAAPPEAKAA
ncbi:response regulator [Ideonella sp.]|uniref:response regulator n=1 Tax=Ideonella sp. TaxID=1929293 RepID=UPI003BB72155